MNFVVQQVQTEVVHIVAEEQAVNIVVGKQIEPNQLTQFERKDQMKQIELAEHLRVSILQREDLRMSMVQQEERVA